MRLKNLIFPPRCGACEELLPVTPAELPPMLCKSCERALRREMAVQCTECYLPLADCRCVPSLMAKRGFTAHIKLAPFSDTRYPTTRALVMTLKNSADMCYYDALAALLLPGIQAAIKASDKSLSAMGKPPVSHTVISFLPRTPVQKRLYGVDQAAALARALACALEVDAVKLLRRKRKGRVQKSLSRTARLVNARESLALHRKAMGCQLADSRVILVDDVVTTGASMAAAADLLRARELIAVSIALTPRAEKQ